MSLEDLIIYYKEKCDVLSNAILKLQDVNCYLNRETILKEIHDLKKEFNICNDTVIALHRQKEVNG